MQTLLTQDPDQCAPLLARTIPQPVNFTVAGRYRQTSAYLLRIIFTVRV
jgi:hypothetical protein